MPNYVIHNGMAGTQQAMSAVYKTLVSVTALTTALRRGKIFEINVGTLGTPADQTFEYDVSQQTAAGTATAATPNLTDRADGVASTGGFVNYTADGTITPTSSVWYKPLNQRATYRWVAVPGAELVWPATNLTGFALRARSVSGSTTTAGGEIYFSE